MDGVSLLRTADKEPSGHRRAWSMRPVSVAAPVFLLMSVLVACAGLRGRWATAANFGEQPRQNAWMAPDPVAGARSEGLPRSLRRKPKSLRRKPTSIDKMQRSLKNQRKSRSPSPWVPPPSTFRKGPGSPQRCKASCRHLFGPRCLSCGNQPITNELKCKEFCPEQQVVSMGSCKSCQAIHGLNCIDCGAEAYSCERKCNAGKLFFPEKNVCRTCQQVFGEQCHSCGLNSCTTMCDKGSIAVQSEDGHTTTCKACEDVYTSDCNKCTASRCLETCPHDTKARMGECQAALKPFFFDAGGRIVNDEAAWVKRVMLTPREDQSLFITIDRASFKVKGRFPRDASVLDHHVRRQFFDQMSTAVVADLADKLINSPSAEGDIFSHEVRPAPPFNCRCWDSLLHVFRLNAVTKATEDLESGAVASLFVSYNTSVQDEDNKKRWGFYIVNDPQIEPEGTAKDYCLGLTLDKLAREEAEGLKNPAKVRNARQASIVSIEFAKLRAVIDAFMTSTFSWEQSEAGKNKVAEMKKEESTWDEKRRKRHQEECKPNSISNIFRDNSQAEHCARTVNYIQDTVEASYLREQRGLINGEWQSLFALALEDNFAFRHLDMKEVHKQVKWSSLQ